MAKFLDKDPYSYEQERSAFVNQLRQFHASKGTPFSRLPTIAGKELDLYLLYNKVIAWGGLAKVTDQEKWIILQEYFGIPATCGHAMYALRKFYVRYLEAYERIHHQGEDAEEVLRSRSRPATPSSQPQKRNIDSRKGLEIPDQLRVAACMSTQKPRLCEYDKIMFSLQSGLPNEVDFAINVCTLLSNEGRHVLHLERAVKLIDLLLAHCGVFYEGPGGYRLLFDDWKLSNQRDFVTFWYDTVNDADIREIIGPDTLRTKSQCKVKDCELFCVRNIGLKDVEGQRILQVAVILRNLSFEEHNRRVMAAHRTFYRFILLCVHNSCSALRQIGMDTLCNVAEEFILDPIDYRSTQLMFHTVDKAMKNMDKFILLRAMECVEKLSQVPTNLDIIRQCMEERVYRSIIRLLTIRDVQLLLGALEVLLALSKKGQVFCSKIATVEKSIDVLVCLVTLDAQSLGTEAFLGIKIVDHAPDGVQHPIVSLARNQPVSQTPPPSSSSNNAVAAAASPPQLNSRPMMHSATPTPPPPPANQSINRDIENEKFTCQWLHSFYEADSEGSVSRVDLYSDYLTACSKASRVSILTSTNFATCLKMVFAAAGFQRVESDAGPQLYFTGLRKRILPLPFNWQLYRQGPLSSPNYQPQLGGPQLNLASSIMQRMAQRLSPSHNASTSNAQQRLYTQGMISPGAIPPPPLFHAGNITGTVSSAASGTIAPQLQQLILGIRTHPNSGAAVGSTAPVSGTTSTATATVPAAASSAATAASAASAATASTANTAPAVLPTHRNNQQQQQAVQQAIAKPFNPSGIKEKPKPVDDTDMLSPQASLVNQAGVPNAFLQNPLPQHSQAIAKNDPSKSPGRNPASPGKAPPPYRPRTPAAGSTNMTIIPAAVVHKQGSTSSTTSSPELPNSGPSRLTEAGLQEGEVKIEKIPNIHAQLPIDTNQVPVSFPQEVTENVPTNSIPLLQAKPSLQQKQNGTATQMPAEQVTTSNRGPTSIHPTQTVSQTLNIPQQQQQQQQQHLLPDSKIGDINPHMENQSTAQSTTPNALQQSSTQSVVSTKGALATSTVQDCQLGLVSSASVGTVLVEHAKPLPVQTGFQVTPMLPKTTNSMHQETCASNCSTGPTGNGGHMYSAYAVVQNVQCNVPTVLGQVMTNSSGHTDHASATTVSSKQSSTGPYIPIQPKVPSQQQQQQQQQLIQQQHIMQQQQAVQQQQQFAVSQQQQVGNQPQVVQHQLVQQQQQMIQQHHLVLQQQTEHQQPQQQLQQLQQQQIQQQHQLVQQQPSQQQQQFVQTQQSTQPQFILTSIQQATLPQQSHGVSSISGVNHYPHSQSLSLTVDSATHSIVSSQQLPSVATSHIHSPLIKQLLQSGSSVHLPGTNHLPQSEPAVNNTNMQSTFHWVLPQHANIGYGNTVQGVVNLQGTVQPVPQTFTMGQTFTTQVVPPNPPQQATLQFIPPLSVSPSPVQSPALSATSSSSSPCSISKAGPLSPQQHRSEKKAKSKSHKSKKSSKKKKTKSGSKSQPSNCSKAEHGKDVMSEHVKELNIRLNENTSCCQNNANQDKCNDVGEEDNSAICNSSRRTGSGGDTDHTHKHTCNGSTPTESDNTIPNEVQKLKSKLEEASLKQPLLNGYGNGEDLAKNHQEVIMQQAELMLDNSGKGLDRVYKSPVIRREGEEVGVKDRTCRLNVDRESTERHCVNHLVNGDMIDDENIDQCTKDVALKACVQDDTSLRNDKSSEMDCKDNASFDPRSIHDKKLSMSSIVLNERTGLMYDVNGEVIPPVENTICKQTSKATDSKVGIVCVGNVNNSNLLPASPDRTVKSSLPQQEPMEGVACPSRGNSSSSTITNSSTSVFPCANLPLITSKENVEMQDQAKRIAAVMSKSEKMPSGKSCSKRPSSSSDCKHALSSKHSRHNSESSSSKKRRRSSSSSGSSHHKKSSSSDKSKQQQQQQQQRTEAPPEPVICVCDWRGCRRSFPTRKLLHVHASTDHIMPSTYRGMCEWEHCDNIQRQKWSCVSHVLDKHCTEQALQSAAARRQSSLPSSTAGPIAPILYNAHTAYHAIRRSLHNPSLKDLLGDSEGPVTKSIRITAALVLRNLAAYSAEARRSLRKHESFLALLSVSNAEASSTLAKCVGELNDERHLECDISGDSWPSSYCHPQPLLSQSQPPLSQSQQPFSQSQQPFSQSQQPFSQSQPPFSQSQQPFSQSQQPFSQSQQPLSQSQQPLSQSQQPLSQSQQPFSQSQQPFSQSQPPLSQSQQPFSQSQPLLSQFQPPLSQSQPPLSQSQQPLSQFQPPLSQFQPPLSQPQPHFSQS